MQPHEREIRIGERPSGPDSGAFEAVAALVRAACAADDACIVVDDVGIAIGTSARTRDSHAVRSICEMVKAAADATVVQGAFGDERQGTPGNSPNGPRAFAGVAVVASGSVVGALCVLSNTPRTFTPEHVASLKAAAVVVGREIERVQAAHARDAEHQFERQLLNAAQDLAFIGLDATGRIRLWNAGAEHLYGYPRATAVGESHEKLFVETDRTDGTAARNLANADRYGRSETQSWHVRADGTRIWARTTVSAVHREDGSLAGYAMLVRDDTELRNAAHARRTANKRLEEANQELVQRAGALSVAKAEAESASKVKSAFLANMSHELRTPLTALMGFVELLDEEGMTPPQRAELVESIRRNGEHLLTLVGDILDLTRTESLAGESVREQFSPRRLADGVVDLLRHHATGKGISLTWRPDGTLPDAILGDIRRIRQVMLNLVGNAIKFTEEGSIEIVLRMTATRTPIPLPLLEVEVRDTGMGIAAEALPQLFVPFSQVDMSSSRRHGGSGLGLALSKRLAEAAGGGIDVASEVGKGSIFRAWFEIEETTAATHGEHTEKVAMPAMARCEGRILVVDDGPDNRKLIAHHLTKAGAKVETAEHGLAGFDAVHKALAQNTPFDLVVLDMQMPVMDGWTAAAKLRESGVMVPILALTANVMPEARQKCLLAGCTAYMSKPIDRAALLSMCSALMSGQHARAA